MITVTAVLLVSLLASSAVSADEEPPSDDACIEKPCGPLVCQARCVASCLHTSLAPTVDECAQRFCNDFNDNSPCTLNDTACWKNCGFQTSSDDKPAPPTVDDLRMALWPDGFSSANVDPYSIRIEWPSTPDANVYIVEAFPMFGKDPSENDQHIVRNLTTQTTFSFARADLCTVYMVRVMAVNGFGNSPPRYLVVDAWKPALNFDENFDVQGLRREGDYLKVLINFTPPQSWHEGDVELVNSFVRGHQCLGPLDSDIFLSTQPDEDGFYTPMVFINETGSLIELSFPAKIMHSKCLYSYRISALHTRCNITTQLDTKIGAGVDFSINCLSVENSGCQSEDTENIEEPVLQSNASALGQSEVIIVADPEALKELQQENSTTTTPESKEVVAKGDSKEVVIAINGEAIKELEQEEASSTTTTTAAKPESGEIAIIAPPEALKELEEEEKAESTTTSELSTTVSQDSSESKESIPSSSAAPQESSESKEHTPSSTAAPPDSDGADAPLPVIVIIEPRDPNAPQCKLAEFDVSVKMPDESSEEQTAVLSLSWMEEKPRGLNIPGPNHFVIRFGPVQRTLIVEAQPDITEESFLSTPASEDSSEEVSRTIQVTDLSPSDLYAFQICAIYTPTVAPAIPWDTAPRYVVDMSAVNDSPKPTTTTQAPDGVASNKTIDYVDLFIDALNSSFDSAEEAAKKAPKESVSTETSDSDVGILQISLPMQPPPVVNIDVQPVLVTDSSSWSPTRTMWLIMALCLLAITVSAFMFLVLKRSRNRRGKVHKEQQFQPTVMAPVYEHTVPTVTSEVKVPIS